MSHDSLSEIIKNAAERSQQSLTEHEAKKRIRSLPWISTEQALPQNDFTADAKNRRLFLVRLMPGEQLAIARFGHENHDWWVSPTGKLFLPYYGHAVVGWCPLPSNLGDTTCKNSDVPSQTR